MIMSLIGFILGIFVLLNFGSNTDIYKFFKERLDYESENIYQNYTSFSSYSSKTFTLITQYNYKLQDYDSFMNILFLESNEFNNKSYGIIKKLNSIENGIGIILFIFNLLFLGSEILVFIYSLGDKEFTLLSNKIFNILNYTLIISLILSSIFLVLSLTYGILLDTSFNEYDEIVRVDYDSCEDNIMIGTIYGYYGFWHYIVLIVGFPVLRYKFIKVGYGDKPGPLSQFDINGNRIIRSHSNMQIQAQSQLIIPSQINNTDQHQISQGLQINPGQKQPIQNHVAKHGNQELETINNENTNQNQLNSDKNEIDKDADTNRNMNNFV